MPTEIASHIPGRSVHSYDLLAEITERHDLGDREAHDMIHAYLEQLIQDDGEDTVISDRRPVDPGLLEHNPVDRDVYYWLTITDEAADAIRAAVDYERPELWTIPRIAQETGVTEDSMRSQLSRWKRAAGLSVHEYRPHPDSSRPQALYLARDIREILASRKGSGRWSESRIPGSA